MSKQAMINFLKMENNKDNEIIFSAQIRIKNRNRIIEQLESDKRKCLLYIDPEKNCNALKQRKKELANDTNVVTKKAVEE